MEVRAGAVIAGRYRLDRLLGEGGMGQVWAATHTVTRKSSALKFLHAPVSNRADLRRRFMREAQAAAAVNHPNVIAVHDFFELDDGTPAMVMDLLVGESLHGLLSRVGTLSVGETAGIMAPVVSAVGAAHAAGVVHRDLKPDNIFLAKLEGGEVVVKVLDFGIAKLRDPGEDAHAGPVTGTGAVMGTPYYMAIEQAAGEKDVDHRADIWALGVILFECLSGERPVEGDNFGQIFRNLHEGTVRSLRDVTNGVPDDLADLVAKMLAVPREGRPADLREVLRVLTAHTTVSVRDVHAPASRPVHVATPIERGQTPTAERRAIDAAATTELPVAPGAAGAVGGDAPSDPSGPARAGEPSESAPLAKQASNTGAHVVSTEPAAPPPRRGRVLIGAALATSIGVGALVFLNRASSDRPPLAPPPRDEASARPAAAVAVPGSSASADQPPLPRVEPGSSARVPEVASPAPAASAAIDKPAVARTSRPETPKPSPAPSAAAADATAKPVAPLAPSAAAAPKTRKGGLAEDPPF
jgi:serine/threonine-protein kinase